MKSIHIVTATNNSYAKPLGVMLNSLLTNQADRSGTIIYVIESDLSSTNKENLSRITKGFKVDIHFLSIDKASFKDFKEKKHFTIETYYRIVIPDLLSKQINKALYLDPDIIVNEDITKLWNVNIDNYYLAAVRKALISDPKKNKLQIPKKYSYFSAGVLLMNLKNWRKDNTTSKVLSFIKHNSEKIEFCSQDPLNAILYDKWLNIHPKWNFTTDYFKLQPDIKPAIIHFTGNKKPWNHGHPLQDKYDKYLKTTLWD